MKKTLILIVTAVALLAGCAKEKFKAQIGDGEYSTVTFTAQMQNPAATRAIADEDGTAAYVNRCIMEVYYDGELFTRKCSPVTGTTQKTATFSTQLVSNRTYTVAFWADCVNPADLESDYYYKTTDGLDAVAIIDSYAGNRDSRDAFAFCGKFTVVQGGSAFEATLNRPFAQVNVITTDVAIVKKVATLVPEKVSVKLKNASYEYSVLDSSAVLGKTKDLTYEEVLYNWDTTKAESTLSMDYIFAEKEKGVIDIEWKAKKTGDADVSHAFASVPYQRNFRTNIKGALLTTTGQWTVTVDPVWEVSATDEFEYVFTNVMDIKAANEFVEQNKEKKELGVKFTQEPNDAGTPTAAGKNAIVTSLLAEGATYNIDVASHAETLYVGDYDYETTAEGTTYDYTKILEKTSDKTNDAAVNIVVSDNLYIGTLVVNSPSKSVTINGQAVQSGKAYHIENLTVTEVSMNTVIIDKGMIVENLTMVKGGLEIHGTVNHAYLPDPKPAIGDIVVRDCENLDETNVYEVLKEYIAEGYVAVKGRTTEGKWDITPANFKIEGTPDKYFYTLADAVASVEDNGTAEIIVNNDHSYAFANSTHATVKAGQTITIDLNGKTVVTGTSYSSTSHLIYNSGNLTIVDKAGEGSWTHGASTAWISDGSGDYSGSYVSNLITNYGTLTLKSGKLANISQGSASYVADIFSNGTLLIENGTYSAAGTIFRLFYGTTQMTVKGGSFQAERGYDIVQFTGSGSSNNLTIEGGNFVAPDGKFNVYSWGEQADNTSTLTITGGTFNVWVALGEKFNQTGNSVSGGNFYGVWNYGTGKFVSGGNYTNAPGEEVIVDKYEVYENEDPATKSNYPYTVSKTVVAKIGDVKYTTLGEAIDDVPAGTETEITMLKNVETSSTYVIPADKNIVLELNGKTISASTSAATTFALFQNNGVFTVKDNTDTDLNGTGTGKLTTVAYNPDMQPVPGYASNTITNYGKLTIESGLIESASDGKASFAIDNEGENAQWQPATYSNKEKVELYITGGKIISGAAQSIRMYLESSGKTDNIVSVTGGVIDRFWVQDNENATAAKGTLTMNGATILRDCLIGYEDYAEHLAVSIKNSTFGKKLHYELDPTKDGNTLEISNVTAAPYYMNKPDKVLSDGTYTIKGELSLGWVYAANAEEKAAKEAMGIRMEEAGYATWFKGYLTEERQLINMNSCVKDGYELICTDQTAGTYIIQPSSN